MNIKFEDKNFTNNYEKNIELILEQKRRLSGKKHIDIDLSSKWINSQKTKLKKDVAKFLIDNTTYVSFEIYFEAIGTLVEKNYKNITLNAEKIVLFSGKPNKSQYMTSVIALYFIKKFGFREPDIYVSSIDGTQTEYPILIFDDMSYTGSQMGELFQKIYGKVYQKQFQPTLEMSAKKLPKIKLLLYGVNSESLSRLQFFDIIFKINSVKVINKIEYEVPINELLTAQSPFEIFYFKKFDTLREVNRDMCNLTNYFFAPFLFGGPYLSVYFDHKIADDVSTYMKVLQYGPIIPQSYSINTYRQLEENYKSQNNIEDFRLKLEKNELVSILPDLVNKYGENDPIDETDKKISFQPFLYDCEYDNHFYDYIGTASYEDFIYPEVIKGRNEDVVESQDNKSRDELWKFLHDDKNKCLKSFYKKTLRGGKNKKFSRTRKENFKKKSKKSRTKRQR